MDAPALAAAIGGTVVGLAGIVIGWLNSRGERRSALALAVARHAHEREIARRERLYEDRKVAFQELLRQLHLIMLIVERTRPSLGVEQPEPPKPPSDDEWDKMMVSVATFGSEELQEAYEAFVLAVSDFVTLVGTIETAQNLESDTSELIALRNDRRQEARDALKRIERLIRDELAA